MTLKEIRDSRRLTQQELAEQSGVSIRTIQRIEKNTTAGSPYVIKALCKVLKVEVEAISQNAEPITDSHEEINHSPEIEPVASTSINKLKLINFSPSFILFLPFLNVLLPSLFFWKYRKELRDQKEALRIISFQLFWAVGLLILIAIIPSLVQAFAGYDEFTGHDLRIWLFFLGTIFNLMIIFDTAIRLNQSKKILPFVPNLL